MEDKMAGYQHQLNEHEFEPTPGKSEEQGSQEFCRPWGCKELDTTEQQKQQGVNQRNDMT